MKLVLASGSPRRVALLQRIGITPIVDPPELDETRQPEEVAADYVLRVASEKAAVVAKRRPGDVILAADTCVVLDGEPLGKPLDPTHAAKMLKLMSGRDHEVMTAVCVISSDGSSHARLEEAVVSLAPMSHSEIDWYVGTGEPMDKAGGYALQGIAGAFVEKIDGDPTTVVGLPLRATVDLLRVAGTPWPYVTNPT